jgi:hypothetical protein
MLGVVLAVGPAARAQTCPLAETVKAGNCFRINMTMKLEGHMRFRKGDKSESVALRATAIHSFPERVLAVAKTGDIQKTARVYDKAEAAITVNKGRSVRSLRGERKLVVVQRDKDDTLVYCPAGAFFRSELELTAGHFDTLSLPALLPGKAVAVGETWTLPSSVVQALCNFEGLTEQKLVGKLEAIEDDKAVFSIKGSATGIDLGALVKVEVNAKGRFSLPEKRVVALEWTQKDDRGIGAVSPANTVEATTTIERSAIPQPDCLSDVALVSVPSDATPPAQMLQLDYRDPQGRFSLLHGREWHVTAETRDHLIMRLLDRGDFIAQVTVTPWEKATGKDKHVKPEELKQAVHEVAGWEPEKELQAGEVKNEDKRWVYRISEVGNLGGVPTMQNFYLVASPEGEQVVIVFSMNPKQADKLGARDLTFVGSLEVPGAKGR